MKLKLFNTLTRKKEVVKPGEDNFIKEYTCGPTVYHFAHIGNLRTYIFEDLLKRTLLYNRFKVKHVMNITDVGHLTSDEDTGEDKMEVGAKREKKSAWEIAEFYTKAFKEDLKKLNILPPDVWCKATDHIKEQIELIKILEQKGYTYVIEDGVYFDTSKLKEYGKLARLDIKGLQEGARIDVRGKKHKTDFALWKLSPKNQKRQMEWNSPWGIGFPGWHIECSAMAQKYLGNPFDIHCGGIDHIPVHHTNEIAQTEAATGKPLAKIWIHGEFLVEKEGKMSKSKGNILTLAAIEEKGYDPLAYRYLCLTTHYRMQLTFSWDAVESAKIALMRLKEKISSIKQIKESKEERKKIQEQIKKKINDDLDSPAVLASLWSIMKDKEKSDTEKKIFAEECDKVLGLNLQEEQKQESIPTEITKRAEQRQEARKKGDFKKSDLLREEIKQKGFLVEDTKEGFKVKKA